MDGAAWLPPRRPGVLAADLQVPDPLVAAQAELARRLARLRPSESRAWRPHVTVARVRRGQRPRTLDVPPPPALEIAGAEAVLYRSHLGGGGARYEVVGG